LYVLQYKNGIIEMIYPVIGSIEKINNTDRPFMAVLTLFTGYDKAVLLYCY